MAVRKPGRTRPVLSTGTSRQVPGWRRSCGVVATLLLGLAFDLPGEKRASAAVPVLNGRITFSVFPIPPPLVRYLPPRDADIFTVRPNGTALKQVTSGPYCDLDPSWAPDGRTIAFIRGPTCSAAGDIYVVGAERGEATGLTNTPFLNEYSAEWSPDGKKIVFAGLPVYTDRLNESDLYIMDGDGTNVQTLTSDAGGEAYPSWSPDGRWIAFTKVHSLTDAPRIEFVSPDGARRRALVAPMHGLGHAPQWSPDGSKLLLVDWNLRLIYVMKVDGSGLRRLTYGNWHNNWPTWSPDGKQIVFSSDRDGNYKLYRMKPDGSDVKLVVDLEVQSTFPMDWGQRP